MRNCLDHIEVTKVGRPSIYDKPMKQTALWLTDEMIEWLKAQPGSMSEQLRSMIEEKMKHF